MRESLAIVTKAEELVKGQAPAMQKRAEDKASKKHTAAKTVPAAKRARAKQEDKCFMEAWAEKVDLEEIKKNHRKFKRLHRKLARDHLSEEHDEKLAIMHKQQVVKICGDDEEAEAYVEKHLASETYSIETIIGDDLEAGSFCYLRGMFVDVELKVYGRLKLRGNNGKQDFYLDDLINNNIPCVFSEDLLPKAESLVGKIVYVVGYCFCPQGGKTIKIVATKVARHPKPKSKYTLRALYGFSKRHHPDGKGDAEVVR